MIKLGYDDLRRREEATRAALKLCPEGSEGREALLRKWYKLHVERDRRDMAAVQRGLTNLFREPCPVCARRQAYKRAWAARNRAANRAKSQL